MSLSPSVHRTCNFEGCFGLLRLFQGDFGGFLAYFWASEGQFWAYPRGWRPIFGSAQGSQRPILRGFQPILAYFLGLWRPILGMPKGPEAYFWIQLFWVCSGRPEGYDHGTTSSSLSFGVQSLTEMVLEVSTLLFCIKELFHYFQKGFCFVWVSST